MVKLLLWFDDYFTPCFVAYSDAI